MRIGATVEVVIPADFCQDKERWRCGDSAVSDQENRAEGFRL